jgi:hypothetical protein
VAKTSKKSGESSKGLPTSARKLLVGEDADFKSKPKKEEKVKEVRIEQETRHLKVQLTETEIASRGHSAARYRREIATQEAELKSFSGSVKAKIATLEGQLDTALQEFDSGCTYRDVDCHEIWDFGELVVKVIRLDTKEEIERRSMTRDELQLPLPKPKTPEKDGTETMSCHGKPSIEVAKKLKESAVERLNDDGDLTASELRARARKQEALHEAVEEAEGEELEDEDE